MNLTTIIGGFVGAVGVACGASRLFIDGRKKSEPVIEFDPAALPPMEDVYRREIVIAAIEQYHLDRVEIDKHNKPLSKTSIRIGWFALGVGAVSVAVTLYSGFTTFDTSWSSLSGSQISDLTSSLRGIEAEPVGIGCAGAYCDDLAKAMKTAFTKAGWPEVSYRMSGGHGIDGIVGIRVDPIDDRTEAIAKAIEFATKLTIIRADDPRHPSYPPGIHIVIGTKPVDG